MAHNKPCSTVIQPPICQGVTRSQQALKAKRIQTAPVFWTIFSALLTALALDKGLWPLTIFCLVPFLLALDQPLNLCPRLLLGSIFGLTLGLGCGYFVLTCLLVHFKMTLFSALAFFLLLGALPFALLHSLLGLGYHLWEQQIKKQDRFLSALIWPALWVCMEFSKTKTPFILPWANLSQSTVQWTSFVQLADITGSWGLSFILALINVLLFSLIKDSLTDPKNLTAFFRKKRMHCFLLAACLLFPVSYGRIRLAQVKSTISGPGKRVTIVQGNFDLKKRWSGQGFWARLERYLELSHVDDSDRPQMFIWPETTLNHPLQLNRQFWVKLSQTIGYSNILISGGLRKNRPGDLPYNTAYILLGNRLTWYDKQILLPYAETSVLGKTLNKFLRAPERFKSGPPQKPIRTNFGILGICICLEDIYPALYRKLVREGTEVLVNLSNDSWFGKSSMPWMHLAAARLRAIENRRYLLRAANSGISAIIGPAGELIQRSTLDRQSVLSGSFHCLKTITFYTHYGPIIVYLSLGLILLGLIKNAIFT